MIEGSQSYWRVRLNVVETSTNVATNTSTAYWELQIYRTSGTYPMAGTPSIKIYVSGREVFNETRYFNFGAVGQTPITLLSGTVENIAHNNNGTIQNNTISFNWTGSGFSPNNVSASGTYETTKIPRYSQIQSATNFTDEENPTITFTNPTNGYFPLRAKIEAGGDNQLIIRDIDKKATSYTFDLTEEERQTLRSLSKNSNSLSVILTICAMNGEQELSASYLTRIMTIVNANPEFNNFEWETTNYNNLTGNNKNVIKGYSNIKTIVSEQNKAIALKEATLTTYQTTIGSKSVTNNNVTYPVENVIQKVDGASITVFANDSRGNSTPIIKPIQNYINYEKINGSIINLARTQEVNSEVNLRFEGEIDVVNFGATENSIVSCKYYYKETSSSEDFVLGTTQLNVTLTKIQGNRYKYKINQNIAGDLGANGFDINKSFLIRIVINDELDFAEDTETLGNGSPAIAIKGNCVSLGSPYNETLGGRVQINGEVYEGNKQFYSTQEQLIGSWIDGKSLYRKVTELEPKLTQGDNIYNTNITNFKTLVTSRLYFKYNNNWYENWDNVHNKIYKNSGSEYVVNCSGTLTLQQMYLITEYTKTTD